MKKFICILFLLILFLNAYAFSIINNGNGMCLYEDSSIITLTSIFHNTVYKTEFNKIYTHIANDDSILILSDEFSVDIFLLKPYLMQKATLNFPNKIKQMFYLEKFLFIITTLRTYVYIYTGEVFQSIYTNINSIDDIEFINNKLLLLNNNTIGLYKIENNRLTLVDSLIFDSLSAIGEDNFNNLCVIKTHYIYNYEVSDSGFNYINTQFLPHDYTDFIRYKCFIYLTVDSFVYMYWNNAPQSIQLLDSFYINGNIRQIIANNDTTYILTYTDKIRYFKNDYVYENITNTYSGILYDNRGNIVFTGNGVFYRLLNEKLYICGNFIGNGAINNNNLILDDSSIVFIDDTFNNIKLQSLPVCIDRTQDYIAYADRQWNVRYYSINNKTDSIIYSLMLPVYGLNYEKHLIASGSYGINKYDNYGNIINSYIDGKFYYDVYVKDNILGLSSNGIVVLDTLLMIKDYYNIDIKNYIKTDSALYMLTNNGIYQFSDSLLHVIALPNNARTKDFVPFYSNWYVLYEGNVIINVTKNTSYIRREKYIDKFIDLNNMMDYNNIFNILGRNVNIKKNGVYFIKMNNKYKKIINLK